MLQKSNTHGFAGLIEIREFMARFVEDVPALAEMEAAFVDPAQSQHHMEVGCCLCLDGVPMFDKPALHMPLVNPAQS